MKDIRSVRVVQDAFWAKTGHVVDLSIGMIC